METKPLNILVVRFRQMGDAVLTTPLLNTLRNSFPDAHIDFVLNENIAPLFENHPSVDHVIPFSYEERYHIFKYIRKIWRTTHKTHYDVIIDLRSTINTMLFAMSSPSSAMRIGLRKSYTWLAFNHRLERCGNDTNMVDHNIKFAQPLAKHGDILNDNNLTLGITEEELSSFRSYMEEKGIDFSRKVMLVGVVAKIPSRAWPENRIVELLSRWIATYPDMQLVFNYAPGVEEESAKRIYAALGSPKNIFINISARSMRQLAAMAYNCTAYFGNEGGARHIVHAMGRPSLVICSPHAVKNKWLPTHTGVAAWGIAASDYGDTRGKGYAQIYDMITVDKVWKVLDEFIKVNA